MKVSLKWLAEYVDVPADVKEFCDRLDLTGTGVEGVEKTGAALDGVVVGHVETCEAHPDSDHMHVVTVNVGADEPVQIVCGAPNIAAGIKVPVATVGAVLPGDFKIKKSKLRGVASAGMCCSRRELGLGADHEGIWILPEDAPVGMPFADYAKLSDTVLDLEITPNRPDCLSVAGFAREVGAMYQRDWTNPLAEMVAKLAPAADGAPVDEAVSVTIDDPTRCPRYTARVIRGCKVGPSPDWMVERLAAIGQRSINNIVDVTNYILFLLGQPLHAFDLDKLTGEDGRARIVIRAAEDGEELTTLDGEKRTLTSDMTVIATPEQGAVALAGVMGGLETEVTDGTVNILLEAATFEAGRTSRTSRNLGLISESSLRYERGVDDHGIEERSAAAAALIVEVAGGTVSAASTNDAGIVDEWPLVSEPIDLAFRIPRFCAMMGADIPRAFTIDTLERLGCEVADGADADTLAVVAPTFRPDLVREIDLYEEVLRLWGMDRIPATLPGGRERVGTRTHGRARAGHRQRRPACERPQRDDDLLVRRAGRPRAPAHVRRRPGRAGGAHQPAQRRPVRHAPEHHPRPSAQRRLQPEPRREERPALRDGRGVLRPRGQEAAEGEAQGGRRCWRAPCATPAGTTRPPRSTSSTARARWRTWRASWRCRSCASRRSPPTRFRTCSRAAPPPCCRAAPSWAGWASCTRWPWTPSRPTRPWWRSSWTWTRS